LPDSPGIAILLISASLVVRITGLSNTLFKEFEKDVGFTEHQFLTSAAACAVHSLK
jgi:hypothetical protein